MFGVMLFLRHAHHQAAGGGHHPLLGAAPAGQLALSTGWLSPGRGPLRLLGAGLRHAFFSLNSSTSQGVSSILNLGGEE